MINASKSYTNDTLATSPKPAAKSASFVLPHSLICKYLRILSLCISALFTLWGCEKQDVESSSPSDITSSTKTVVTQESLLGDWHIFSAVVPVYPASYSGETKPEPSPHIPPPTIFTAKLPSMASPLALFPQEDSTIVMRGNDIEIKILKIENRE